MDQILIDANILDYGTKKHGAAGLDELLEKIKAGGLDPLVSAYTTFEVYRGLASSKVSAVREIISALRSVEVDLKCFKISALLYTCYQRNDATKRYLDRYSDGDLVLAGSSLRYNMAILTANGNDFPRPFFYEVDSTIITVDTKKQPVVISHLRPNIGYFNDQIAEHYVS